MTTSEARPRLYRFGPRDRTGWLLGLQGAQCLALGAGILVAGTLLNAGAPMPVVVAPLLAAAGYAFARANGHAVHELVPVWVRWNLARAARETRWFAPLPVFRPGNKGERVGPELPAPLAGLSIAEAGAAWARRGRAAGAAIVRDEREHTVSSVLRVHGREFSLCERSEQERLLQLWGDALSAFCAERGPVSRVRWTEWAAPASLQEQLAYLAEHRDDADQSTPLVAYRELLDAAGPMATRHEVLIAVTVEQRRVRARRPSSVDHHQVAEEKLLEEVRLLGLRLEAAGLIVDAPLTPSEMAAALRVRLDPFGTPGMRASRRHSLVELAGLVTVPNAGPLALDVDWAHVRVDGACHAAYVIAEWPRLEVPPNWIEPLLLHAGGIRTVALHYEPVPPSRSQRQIDRETVKLLSDEEQRSRSGFRIGARHRRAQAEVLDRETELVAGYGELEFTGFVVVTAADLDELERSCVEYEQVAAQSGLELRRLNGRHDLALACMLPIGRGIAPRRFR
jgi:hypothetical protein